MYLCRRVKPNNDRNKLGTVSIAQSVMVGQRHPVNSRLKSFLKNFCMDVSAHVCVCVRARACVCVFFFYIFKCMSV